MIIFALILIPFGIWMIALMYNAYTVSCHLKGARAVISFIVALLVAEIVSKVILIFLLSGMFANSSEISIVKTNSIENTEVITELLTIRQKTENVVKAFEQGNFDAITAYFDETMKKSLPATGLRMSWTQIVLAFGAFEKAEMDNLKETQMDKYHIVTVPLVFQKEKRTLQLSFNSAGEINGLYIR
jgi:hypothetical protein